MQTYYRELSRRDFFILNEGSERVKWLSENLTIIRVMREDMFAGRMKSLFIISLFLSIS